MGLAIAQVLAENGYEVELVLGPTQLSVDNPGIHITAVTTAQEMYDASMKLFPDMDIAIMSAAVADYRPKQRATQKIKKERQESVSIDLVQNPDILAALGKIKKPHQTLVGFALETNDELAHAEEKLQRKNADFIALNSLRDANAGFGFDTNKVTLIGKDNFRKDLPLQSKREIAKSIVACVTRHA
jgi:phosphopantothenoylcysteine decarboxylase/phosphopantothenate--cysteine ligase